MKKLKMAIIGAGQIAQVTHIPNYLKMEAVELVGICDVNKELAESAATQFGLPCHFESHQEMIEKIKPDAVTVCVPNKFHCSIVMDALQSGCHVLCEKPPAVTAAEAYQMEQAAKMHGRILSYGFHFRHSQEVKFIREKCERQELGDIYAARVQWLRRRGIPGWGNFTNKEIQGGGPLIDIGAHMLDAALYCMDYPEIAYVCANTNGGLGKTAKAGLMGQWNRDRFDVEDSLFGYIQFVKGASLSIATSFALNMKERDVRKVELFGDKLGVSLFPLEAYGEEGDQLINIQYPYIQESDRHYTCSHNFVQACCGEEELVIKPEQGTYIQKVIQALYDSAATGQPVIWKEKSREAWQ